MPSSVGSASTRSAIRSLALWIAPAEHLEHLLARRPASSIRWMVSIATAEARSPAAAPPIPSATTSRCGLAKPESWLFLRIRPISEWVT